MEKKQYELKILPLFEHDLNAITDYIAYRLRNPDAADHLIDAVEKANGRILRALSWYCRKRVPVLLDKSEQLHHLLCCH